MVKAIIIELSATPVIPDTEQDKSVTITITDAAGTRTYTGKLSVILTYTPSAVVPPSSTVTLKAPGLVSA